MPHPMPRDPDRYGRLHTKAALGAILPAVRQAGQACGEPRFQPPPCGGVHGRAGRLDGAVRTHRRFETSRTGTLMLPLGYSPSRPAHDADRPQRFAPPGLSGWGLTGHSIQLHTVSPIIATVITIRAAIIQPSFRSRPGRRADTCARRTRRASPTVAERRYLVQSFSASRHGPALSAGPPFVVTAIMRHGERRCPYPTHGVIRRRNNA